jgi:transposase
MPKTKDLPGSTPKPKAHNQYTALEITNPLYVKKAICKVMLDQGATYEEIYKHTRLSPLTISRVKKGEYENQIAPLAEELKRTESAKLTLKMHEVLDGVTTPEKIAEAKLLQGITGFGILYDKRALNDGKPTVRFGMELPDDALNQKIRELEAEVLEAEEIIAGEFSEAPDETQNEK